MQTESPCPVAMTDEELLDRFVSHRDAAAFEALVLRHGPMVLGVCRRILQHPQDAEDAFQATFLVLLRKAASLGQRALLGNWLYGVAYRTALEARTAVVRRYKREKQVSAMPEPMIHDDPDEWRDWRPYLDQELNRLPGKYRIPIVLCDLEGKTRQDAAELLDVPIGTLSGRLTKARQLLAKRLARRGLSLSVAALMAVLSQGAASAAVSAPLLSSTVQAAAGSISAPVAALTAGVMKAMLLKKLKIATAVLLTIVAGAAAVMVQADRGAAGPGAAKVLDLGMGQRGRRVVWSPDGKTLVVTTIVEMRILGIELPKGGSAIRLWDVESGQMRKTLDDSGDYKGLAFQKVVFSADGKTIAATVDQNHPVTLPNGGMRMQGGWVVKLWDAKTLVLKHTLPSDQQLFALALSPDGKLVAAGSSQLLPPRYTTSKRWIKLWNAQTGALERTLEFGPDLPTPVTFAFSPDSKTFVLGCQKDGDAGQVQWWDAQTWKMKCAVDQEECVISVMFSGNGKMLASASYKGAIQLWDAQKRETILSLNSAHPWPCLAISPNGRTVATGGKDGKVRLWNTQTGEWTDTLEGHGSNIQSLAFSPDGKTLASTSQDATVRLWPINPHADEQK